MGVNLKIFERFPEYETERILLRDFKHEDRAGLLELRSNKEAMKYIDNYPFGTLEEADERIKLQKDDFNEKRGITWAMEEKGTGRFMGYFGFFNMMLRHSRAEAGYMLLPRFWNKGFMSETFKLLLPNAFDEMRFHSIEANVNPANAASIKLLENFGFKREAYYRENYFFDGKFLDSAVYSLLREDLIIKQDRK